MDKPQAAENVFARALELPAGSARQQLLLEECRDNPALLVEVQSLLRAHEWAGSFLECNPGRPSEEDVPAWRSVAAGEGRPLDAAAPAKAFLSQTEQASEKQVRAYVMALPQALRREARERIEAGLRVRQFGRAPRSGQDAGAEEDPPRLPGFKIERRLGTGSLGAVYLARDEKLDRQVAIKVLRCGGDEQLRRRALDEARKAAALADPAVVTIFSVLDEAGSPAIVMEWLEGFALDRFAAQLSFEQKARLLREVARGLAAAHQRGLIHRDLKPENILVGPDLQPKILDFGLALTLEEAARQNCGFEGTPLYASPEQVMGRPLTPSSDVFSFGSLMFKVLTGRTPFAGSTTGEVLSAIATTSPPFLSDVAVGVPEELQAVCLACLAWNPADRPGASDIVVELGRFLVGEPVRLKPRLYIDLLRQHISEYSNQARAWQSQSIITPEERDALEGVHRRLLADEDHWIIDARRITVLQTVLSGATWLAVVSAILTVWLLRGELGPFWRWAVPVYITGTLFLAGWAAERDGEPLGAATFLAGAALAVAPAALALLAEARVFALANPTVTQLFPGTFTNQQVLAASIAALAVSAVSLCRLKMTAFAWTTATLALASYFSVLLLKGWLDRQPEIQALWCLPLAAMEGVALVLERRGRVRWTMPFHLVALVALVAALDVMAVNGPTLEMLGIDFARSSYFGNDRLTAFSLVLNGVVFLGLMLVSERAASLDLRRASKLLEILAIVHILGPLFVNALSHRGAPHVRVDVWLYLGAALSFLVAAPCRSRWRLLVGGLAGCGLGSYLLVELGLVDRKPFIVGLGFAGLILALGTFAFVRRRSRGRDGRGGLAASRGGSRSSDGPA